MMFKVGVLCLMMSSVVSAENLPHTSVKDPRIQSVYLKKDDVIPLTVPLLTSFRVALAESEEIDSIESGDATAWDISQHKLHPNEFFIKPKIPQSRTNLTVLTEDHTYYFTLKTKLPADNTPDYLGLNVLVPKSLKKLPIPDSLQGLKKDGVRLNNTYTFSGRKYYAPLKVYDNDEFTYFEFKKNQAIPAFFAVDNRKGSEAIVNFNIENNTVIIKHLSPQWTLRDGTHVVSVFNQKLLKEISHGK